MEWRRLVQGGEINAVAVPARHDDRRLQFAFFAHPCPEDQRPGRDRQVRSVWADARTELPRQQDPDRSCSIRNATALLQAGLFPGPNAAGGRYYASVPNRTNYREETFRVDHRSGANWP